MEKVKAQCDRSELSVEELKKAELDIIHCCQRQRYSNELLSLQKCEQVKKNNHICKLNPILEDGVLREEG